MFALELKLDGIDDHTADEMMFAWHRGRRAFTAAALHQLVCEDSALQKRPLQMVSLDARHQFDQVHVFMTAMSERSRGYPPELIAVKARLRCGPIRIRTEYGLTVALYAEQRSAQQRRG